MGKDSFLEGNVEHLSKTPALNCPISLLTIAKLLWLIAARLKACCLDTIFCSLSLSHNNVCGPEGSRRHWTCSEFQSKQFLLVLLSNNASSLSNHYPLIQPCTKCFIV